MFLSVTKYGAYKNHSSIQNFIFLDQLKMPKIDVLDLNLSTSNLAWDLKKFSKRT